MYLIVGLGNPEEEYSKTRHNMGFNTINKLSQQYNIDVKQNKFQALYGSGIIEKEKVILLKPQTYMNLSGNSVKEVVDFYKIEKEKILVIYDDMDIDPGKIKIRKRWQMSPFFLFVLQKYLKKMQKNSKIDYVKKRGKYVFNCRIRQSRRRI